MATAQTIYIDTNDLATASNVWSNVKRTILAPDGWYSNGTITRFKNNGILEGPVAVPIDCDPDPTNPTEVQQISGSVSLVNNLLSSVTIDDTTLASLSIGLVITGASQGNVTEVVAAQTPSSNFNFTLTEIGYQDNPPNNGYLVGGSLLEVTVYLRGDQTGAVGGLSFETLAGNSDAFLNTPTILFTYSAVTDLTTCRASFTISGAPSNTEILILNGKFTLGSVVVEEGGGGDGGATPGEGEEIVGGGDSPQEP